MKIEEIRRKARPIHLTLHWAAALFVLWLLVESLAGFLSPVELGDTLGLAAITFLTISLACTPVNIIFNFPPILRIRRDAGVYAFVFASLHLWALVWGLEKSQWNEFWNGIGSSGQEMLGVLTFIILLVLTATSFKSSRQRLKRYWKRLHRSVYVAGVLAALHLSLAPHAPPGLGLFYLIVILMLLTVRLPPVKTWFVSKYQEP